MHVFFAAARRVAVRFRWAIVVAGSTGTLTAADTAAVGRLATGLAKVAGVRQVENLGVSRDGKAVQLVALASINFGTQGPADQLVAGLRGAIRGSSLPAGLQAHLAGQVAAQADAGQAGQRTVKLGEDLSIIFIVVLLLVVFRSVLAPLLALAPAVLVSQLAGPVIGEASKAGLQVTSLTQIMLLILTLGAGTDYGLFLVFRVREELRAGRAPRDAVSQRRVPGRRVDHVLRRDRHRRARACAATEPAGALRRALAAPGRRRLALDTEIRELEAQITALISAHAPGLLARHGAGAVTAARLPITAGANPPGGAATPPRPRRAAPARCRLPPARPAGTGSTAAATARPATPGGSSPTSAPSPTRAPGLRGQAHRHRQHPQTDHPHAPAPHRPRAIP